MTGLEQCLVGLQLSLHSLVATVPQDTESARRFADHFALLDDAILGVRTLSHLIYAPQLPALPPNIPFFLLH
jgi:hypothetical protein